MTSMSRTEIAGMLSWSECQLSPSSKETQTCVSVDAYSRPFLRGSSRMELADGAAGDAVVDLGPGLAAISSATGADHIVEPQSICSGVRGLRCRNDPRPWLKMRRPRLHLRRCDVGPFFPAVHRDLNDSVAGAGPEHVHIERRWRKPPVIEPYAATVTVDAYLPAFVGTSQLWRVRSPLIAVQLCPALEVFQTPAVA